MAIHENDPAVLVQNNVFGLGRLGVVDVGCSPFHEIYSSVRPPADSLVCQALLDGSLGDWIAGSHHPPKLRERKRSLGPENLGHNVECGAMLRIRNIPIDECPVARRT